MEIAGRHGVSCKPASELPHRSPLEDIKPPGEHDRPGPELKQSANSTLPAAQRPGATAGLAPVDFHSQLSKNLVVTAASWPQEVG